MKSLEDISELSWKWRYKIKNTCMPSKDSISASSPDLLDDDSKPSEPVKDPKFGAEAAIKTFYEGKDSNDSYYDWVDYPPKQLSKSAAKAQDRVAIKVYKIKDKDKPVLSGRFHLKYHMIELQNPTLIAALKDIMKKEDLHLDVTENATFKEPFKPLYFRYDEITALHKSTKDTDPLKQHLGLLLKLMHDIFGETKIRIKNLHASGLISYKLAWTYFPKNSIIYSWGHNCELLAKVVDTEYKKTNTGTTLCISCKVITFDGESFIWKELNLEIPPFQGNKPILDLDHYPLSFHKQPEVVKETMKKRGTKVLDFQGLTYCSYTGIGIFREKKVVEKHNVDGRILIDIVGYNKHHLALGQREGLDPELQKNRILGPPEDDVFLPALKEEQSSDADEWDDFDLETPAPKDAEKKPSGTKRLTEAEQKKNKDIMLAREADLVFVSPILEGYALKNKLWMTFFVDDIEPMIWNDEAFGHLVYDEQQKDLVLSFVENHRRTKPTLEDVIVGKGQGLIILLSGPPGTGKTLTAEAVADRTRRPLFYLQAEDLGVNPSTLGANIKKVFEMATEWDAVILLDEADVFMAERHPNDITRNELVSIFLRELEYFRGIIFLTTNLYDTIDTAFRSRVNIHLLFKSLGAEARGLVWRKFLERLVIKDVSRKTSITHVSGDGNGNDGLEEVEKEGINGITDEDIKELSKWQLNGREIKNAIKMVKSWCDSKEYELTLARLENGIKVTSPHASRQHGDYDSSLYES